MKTKTLLLAAFGAASLDPTAALPQGAIAPGFSAPAALAGKRVSYVLHEALVFGISHDMRYVELYTEDISAYPVEVTFAHEQLAQP